MIPSSYCSHNLKMIIIIKPRSLLTAFYQSYGPLSLITIEKPFQHYTRSGNILSFLLPLFQEGQLSVTGESMCTKYWLTA